MKWNELKQSLFVFFLYWLKKRVGANFTLFCSFLGVHAHPKNSKRRERSPKFIRLLSMHIDPQSTCFAFYGLISLRIAILGLICMPAQKTQAKLILLSMHIDPKKHLFSFVWAFFTSFCDFWVNMHATHETKWNKPLKKLICLLSMHIDPQNTFFALFGLTSLLFVFCLLFWLHKREHQQ